MTRSAVAGESKPRPRMAFELWSSDVDAAEADGEMFGVAEEVGVGRQDLERLDDGHGADQEIDGRTLDTLLAAEVAEFGGSDEVFRPQGDILEGIEGLAEILELRRVGHAGEKLLSDRPDQYDTPVLDQVLDQGAEALVRRFAPQHLRPDAGVDEDPHRLRASL